MRLFTTLAFVLAVADVAVAQDGASVFKSSCAACHAAEDGRPQNAPSIEVLRRFTPESILNSLVNGKMRIQGTPLSESDRRTVAEFLGGRPLVRRAQETGTVGEMEPATPALRRTEV
jgi:mono/diheme cytochrome c family protein